MNSLSSVLGRIRFQNAGNYSNVLPPQASFRRPGLRTLRERRGTAGSWMALVSPLLVSHAREDERSLPSITEDWTEAIFDWSNSNGGSDDLWWIRRTSRDFVPLPYAS